MTKISLFCCVILCCINNFSSGKEYKEHFRLPTEVIPINYIIKLKPNIDAGTFKGNVTIVIDVTSKVDSIILHSINLNFTYVSLDLKDNDVDFLLEPKYETMQIFYTNKSRLVDPGAHVLYFEYEGSLINDIDKNGFTRFPYAQANKTGYVLVTQFEATYARRAFPCFDEPQMKSTFSVKITTPNNTYRALSNMKNIAVIHKKDGSVIYDFQKSVMMSTYLNSFTVTDFPYIESHWCHFGKRIPLRLYSQHALGEGNSFTLKVAKHVLSYLSDYTGLVYPLPKLDFIEYDGPEDEFATENWGLIVGRRGVFTRSADLYGKDQIGMLAAHEVIHSWFGNLVTDLWWDDLWLHEGFTTFMTYKFYRYFHYSSDDDLESTGDLQNTQYLDLTNETSPVATFALSPNDTESRFSDFVYTKGSSLVQTMEQIVGECTFRRVIRTFLEKYKYKSASTNDFINVIEEIVPETTIRNFLTTWLYQTGHPILYMKENKENSTIILTQEEYPNTFITNSSKRKRWTIPIAYFTDTKSEKWVWFDQDMDELIIPVAGINWIKFNPGQITMYRVNYTENMWNSLIDNIKELQDIDQAGLLYESGSLVSSGITDCKIYFKLMHKIVSKNENNPAVIKSAVTFTLYQVVPNIFKDDEAGYFKALNYIEIKDKPEYDTFFEEKNKHSRLSLDKVKKCRDWMKEQVRVRDENDV